MLGIYIHCPYCTVRCGYCNFHVQALGEKPAPSEPYTQAVVQQLHACVERYSLSGREVGSVFFGGGTPSMLAPSFFRDVLLAIRDVLTLSPDAEITSEVNPVSGKRAWLEAIRDAGINRLSTGIQSFVPQHLKLLDRTHTADDIHRILVDMQAAGFDNISCDLIFGIPGQTVSEVEEDVRRALSFGVPHFSAYQLTLEPGTPLYKKYHYTPIKTSEQGRVTAGFDRGDPAHLRGGAVNSRRQDPPQKSFDDEETILSHMSTIERVAHAQGLKRYEISNYARSGFESRHNLHYWRYGEYLGLGSGAVSCLGSRRWHTTRNIERYLAGDFAEGGVDIISPRAAMGEFCFLGLRTMEGISMSTFAKRFGTAFDDIYPGLVDRLVTRELLDCRGDRVFLTACGIELSNEVFRQFV